MSFLISILSGVLKWLAELLWKKITEGDKDDPSNRLVAIAEDNTIECPNCDAKYRVGSRSEYVGKRFQCQKCQSTITVLPPSRRVIPPSGKKGIPPWVLIVGAGVGLLLLMPIVSMFSVLKDHKLSPEAKAHIVKIEGLIKDGDMYWDKGDKDRAIEAYIVVLDDGLSGGRTEPYDFPIFNSELGKARIFIKGQQARLFTRCINHLTEKQGEEPAKELIRMALNRYPTPDLPLLTTKAARLWQDERERNERESKR